MKVWLDDVREAPKGWILVTNYEDCIELLATGKVCYLSLDHDLGIEQTGYDVATWIERKVWEDDFYPPVIEIHSANPVGRRNIQAAIASIKRGRRGGSGKSGPFPFLDIFDYLCFNVPTRRRENNGNYR